MKALKVDIKDLVDIMYLTFIHSSTALPIQTFIPKKRYSCRGFSKNI